MQLASSSVDSTPAYSLILHRLHRLHHGLDWFPSAWLPVLYRFPQDYPTCWQLWVSVAVLSKAQTFWPDLLRDLWNVAVELGVRQISLPVDVLCHPEHPGIAPIEWLGLGCCEGPRVATVEKNRLDCCLEVSQSWVSLTGLTSIFSSYHEELSMPEPSLPWSPYRYYASWRQGTWSH